jgi:hypothetical protein
MIYLIETPKEIFWSDSKIDTIYRHVEFLYRDRAFYKEMDERRFSNLKKNTSKKVYRISS